MATLVDSHVHLDRYTDEEVTAMVSRGAAAGVARLLTIGVDLATSQAALRLAERHQRILAAVGIHPTRLSPTPQPPPPVAGEGEQAAVGAGFRQPIPTTDHPNLPAFLPSPADGGRGDVGGADGRAAQRRGPHGRAAPESSELRGRHDGAGGGGHLADLTALLDANPAAIGEVGLDESAPDLDGQQRFLAACLRLAADRDLPLVLHVVGETAIHEAALAIVGRHPAVRTVAHYFVGGPDLARRYLEAGCWISVGRPVTRPTETAIRAAVPTIPLDRLLLETDTYPLPGRTTEPRDVATVCSAVAELTGRTYEEIAAATTASFARFIGW